MKVLVLIFLFVSLAHAESGFVRKLTGEVLIDGKVVKENDKVLEGQAVEARGSKSVVVIKFESGSQVVLKDGSMKLEVPKVKGDSAITLTKGIFASHFINKGKRGQTVKTGHASMGIRGTKYYIEEKPESSYLCVCEGKVEISDGKKTEMIGMNEDALAAPGKTLEKTKANQMMVDMAQALVKEME